MRASAVEVDRANNPEVVGSNPTSATNPKGYLDEHSFDRTFKRQCERCRVKPFSPHALRHYFATHSLRNGAWLEIVSRILGHASVAITIDLYTHINSEEMHDGHRRFVPFANAAV